MIKLLPTFWKLNLKSALEYKTSFIIQVIWMFVSDIFTIIIWYFFFLKFWNIWGMWMNEYVILYSTIIFVFCFTHIFFGWYWNISKNITDWWLDSYLLLPKNTLFILLTSKLNFSVFWDLLFGITLLFFIKWFTLFMLLQMLLFSFLWSLVLLGFMIFFHSLGFFIWSSREMSRLPIDLLLWPAHYPPDSFEGTFLKKIFISIIPLYFSFFYPYQLVIKFELSKFILLLLASVLYFWFSYWFFYKGIKKYESGNMMNVGG